MSGRDLTEVAIFEVVQRHILAVLTDLDPSEITPHRTMRELGANSIDRMDVVVATMQELEVEIPPERMSGVHDLGSLVEVLHEGVTCASQPSYPR
jgi:polyketide biosynthesis acyl carrier protein